MPVRSHALSGWDSLLSIVQMPGGIPVATTAVGNSGATNAGLLEQVLFGPSHQADGKTNFIGALKRAMASTGYVDVKNFQRCGMVVNPYSAR